MSDPTRQSRWIARRRAERVAAGLCAECGGAVETVSPPPKRRRGRPRTGTLCDKCRDRRS